MIKLEREEYERTRSIFAELAEIHLNIAAVLEGTAPGAVYVDDAIQPQSTHMTSGDAVYLAGAPDNHAFNTALNAFLPRDTYFVLFCDLPRWEGTLDIVLKDTYAVQARRRYYALKQHRIGDWQDRIPDGFSMQRVDPELLTGNLKNGDEVVAGILDEWLSVDAFFAQGFGFCLVHESDIVSWSLADYVRGDRCEMGINTDWHHRRQGLGTLTAAANAAHAAACGFSTIGWHCWDNNVGSIRVAENVGFERTADYGVFINHWVSENITDMTEGEFRAFAKFYEAELETCPPVSGFPHIVTAKAWALSGDRDGCFRHLNKAVDIGWLRSVGHLRRIWPEFFWNPNRDNMPEWQALVRRLGSKG
jgi:hypothetical protein